MDVFLPADILLPKGRDLARWSVIACDQFTSEGAYWEEADRLAGEAPSALRMILPEAWLGTERGEAAEERIAGTMEAYLRDGLFEELPGSYIYVERTQPDGRVRRGLVGALDLESYDFAPGTRAAVRATEATVEERLPPRIRIRAAAALEMPHVMLLADDRDDRVLGPLAAAKHRMKKVYDFDLMLGGGHLSSRLVRGALQDTVRAALASLGEPELQREKYGAAAENGPMVLAVGDGNHSLAAAKRLWESVRGDLSPEERLTHPARFALAELVNVHDPALDFEPIHRVIFDTDAAAFPEALREARAGWDGAAPLGDRVAAADRFCRAYIAAHGGRVDYVHGDAEAAEMGARPGCGAVLLPPVEKDGLFLSVLLNGSLPKKSFSMGTARDKRYYLECRRIR